MFLLDQPFTLILFPLEAGVIVVKSFGMLLAVLFLQMLYLFYNLIINCFKW